ncbi:hypothetical protein [Streptomyces malaysiensis]|uniref:hypothetical protein n=1 Tax=Streptomyces malaysiensis TaxID=92644 RepID=UPI0036799591
MDDEDERFSLGVGVLVRAATNLEYILHGLAANLLGDCAYGAKWAADPVSRHIEACEGKLQGDTSPIPSPARESLLGDLKSCRRALERRNLFVHCCWTFDDETQLWWGVKANREKPTKGRLQVEHAESYELPELAAELDRLHGRMLAWDIKYFGEDGDPEMGQPGRVSVKRSKRAEQAAKHAEAEREGAEAAGAPLRARGRRQRVRPTELAHKGTLCARRPCPAASSSRCVVTAGYPYAPTPWTQQRGSRWGCPA